MAVTPTARSNGLSEGSPADLTLAGEASDLRAVLDWGMRRYPAARYAITAASFACRAAVMSALALVRGPIPRQPQPYCSLTSRCSGLLPISTVDPGAESDAVSMGLRRIVLRGFPHLRAPSLPV